MKVIHKKCGIIIALFGISMILLYPALVWNGVILLNHPPIRHYPVRGVDVSSYQGDIDWEILASQQIAFAFIKATEGSSYVDPRFAYNFAQALKTNLRVGAYHFFSYDSEGRTQADHFMETVKRTEDMLPPVIDLEFYGDKENHPPSKEEVQKQLLAMMTKLEEHYDVKPIIYCTEKSYELFLEGGFKEYDIWIRNVISRPKLSDDRAWTFWQYTNREQIKGYKGEEKYIDFNVFYGSEEAFSNY